jgi:hypothetical protein
MPKASGTITSRAGYLFCPCLRRQRVPGSLNFHQETLKVFHELIAPGKIPPMLRHQFVVTAKNCIDRLARAHFCGVGPFHTFCNVVAKLVKHSRLPVVPPLSAADHDDSASKMRRRQFLG